jgi:anti-sigma factor RsiW
VTCREFTDVIIDYLAGELSPHTENECESHLDTCRSCPCYLASYEESVRLIKRAFADDDGPFAAAVSEDLVSAIVLAARPFAAHGGTQSTGCKNRA